MKIKVERCWNGAKEFYTLFLPNGRERVYEDVWDKKTATLAIDLLENVYHLKRKNIKFVHH